GCLLAGWLVWALTAASDKGPVQVAALEVRAYRVQGDRAVLLGMVGDPGLGAVRVGDRVRVSARLSRPGHVYMIAFNPDGKDQLCHPPSGSRDRPPARLTELSSPDSPDGSFQLTEAGLQAFVLIGARRQLPAYDEWKSRHGPAPWQPGQARGI